MRSVASGREVSSERTEKSAFIADRWRQDPGASMSLSGSDELERATLQRVARAAEAWAAFFIDGVTLRLITWKRRDQATTHEETAGREVIYGG